jgi:hypothetical protein
VSGRPHMSHRTKALVARDDQAAALVQRGHHSDRDSPQRGPRSNRNKLAGRGQPLRSEWTGRWVGEQVMAGWWSAPYRSRTTLTWFARLVDAGDYTGFARMRVLSMTLTIASAEQSMPATSVQPLTRQQRTPSALTGFATTCCRTAERRTEYTAPTVWQVHAGSRIGWTSQGAGFEEPS